MKLDNFSDVYFVVSVLVPGFIYSCVVSNFVPLRPHKEKETLILRYLTATVFNYAICSPIIYFLVSGYFIAHPIGQAITLKNPLIFSDVWGRRDSAASDSYFGSCRDGASKWASRGSRAVGSRPQSSPHISRVIPMG